MAKEKKTKRKFRKRYVVCQEVKMGKYIMLDTGAIHDTFEEAEEHALDCDTREGVIVIAPLYFLDTE